MSLDQFVGLTLDEESLFQRLIFEIEGRKEFYHLKYFQLIIEPTEQNEFLVSEIVEHHSYEEQTCAQRQLVGQKYYCEVSSKNFSSTIHLFLVRPNRTATWAEIMSSQTI